MSTLPEHITRRILISVEYCSLETPARSAAPYAHQLHAKPNIFGLNLKPVLIVHTFLYSYRVCAVFKNLSSTPGCLDFRLKAVRQTIMTPLDITSRGILKKGTKVFLQSKCLQPIGLNPAILRQCALKARPFKGQFKV